MNRRGQKTPQQAPVPSSHYSTPPTFSPPSPRFFKVLGGYCCRILSVVKRPQAQSYFRCFTGGPWRDRKGVICFDLPLAQTNPPVLFKSVISSLSAVRCNKQQISGCHGSQTIYSLSVCLSTCTHLQCLCRSDTCVCVCMRV